jgi:hypothetical protein
MRRGRELTARQLVMRASRLSDQLANTVAECEVAVRTDDAEQLAVAIKALRTIANMGCVDDRSRGLARGALRRMRVPK